MGGLADGGLGEVLRELRELKGYSLRQVEKRSGVSNAYLSQIESGKVSEPSPRFLHKLADVYEVPYTELMKLAGYLTSSQDSKDTTNNLLGIAMSTIDDLTADERAEVAKYIHFIRSKRRRSG